mmetsp:Transcript_19822/g.24444  ORF Transcript_19822/g.24444 Transcript_19822/m.24444 type:complete len:843 (+) Transcript_19822:131-2659(+)
MESGSLLPEALRYMQRLREYEEKIPAASLHLKHDGINDNSDGGDKEIGQAHQNVNALVVSLYCIDSQDDVPFRENNDKSKDNGHGTSNRKRIRLHQKLANVHSIIHTQLLPSYHKRYPHKWFTGGEGISFGLHCKTNNAHGTEQEEETIPHLRAVIGYGPHPIDEYHALAIINTLTKDLFHKYQIRIAASCWDIDDGQILLIEAADALPSWVDNDIGVQGMEKRVYVVNGNVVLLDPSICGKNNIMLSRKEALSALISIIESNGQEGNESKNDVLQNRLNAVIHKRIGSFCHVIQNKSINLSTRRQVLKDHLHTAAVVLPLHLALLIKERPDLLPCAINTFCRLAPSELKKKSKMSKQETGDNTKQTNLNDEACIEFENLVFTTMTLSKSLYAMLLTASGIIPPPMKIPRHYKSVELNRMKRKCIQGGDGYSHFRHSIELGIRLALGFEWILKTGKVRGSDGTNKSKEGIESKPLSCSTRDRICFHHVRIDEETGGDEKWIERAWEVGPNATEEEDDINALIKCPVWNPEICAGGICPLTHPGKSVHVHVRETLRNVQKKEMTSTELSSAFPFPRAQDVDSDSWIDMNFDDLDKKMTEIQNVTREAENDTAKSNNKTMMNNEIETIMDGLNSFVNSKSDIAGVSTSMKKSATPTTTIPTTATVQNYDPLDICPKTFLTILYRVLKNDSEEEVSVIDLLSPSSNAVPLDDQELFQYFAKEDLDFMNHDLKDDDDDDDDVDMVEHDEDVDSENESGSIRDFMRAMDEELLEKDFDRDFKVTSVSKMDNSCDENITKDLPSEDPMTMNVNVLSNLLESLDAQDGAPGPVSTLLKEMGIKAPGDVG